MWEIYLLQGLAGGLVTGSIYALIALSLVIIYKSTQVINFAGGEIVMIASYVALFVLLYTGMSYWIVVPLCAISTFIIGISFERVVLTRIQGRQAPGQSVLVAMVIATVGLSYILKGIIRPIPYADEVRTLPPMMAIDPVFIGPAVISRQDIAIFGIAVFSMIALFVFFQFTPLGRALRATADNARAAALVGIPVARMRALVWGLACGLSAIAGILIAPKVLMTPDMGGLIILAFAAAIIGGFTNFPGVIVGGFALGIIENIVGLTISSNAISVTPFIVIILVLLVRPQGLFGGPSEVKKV
ncbi:MAG: branched-chain amino acid ABC transporter permease [Alphaproteobacteria bacterium]|jgi:branched-chain amino acid transport system permease protein|nr:branched-chain amino acid ABC transporter permease [Alphaproteobacteria bacterium]MBT4083125.1 branched-chain amino acid ABC transporter permease [Alphaproteobacteria bacterium]MBT4542381.1 branched-chain amino acid ABC transporter permease [Alphaproteobacteria bacterium]MBT5160011.1 branched-chain amino acid ABC transporter permease [Alphaproteobacteria bacterium]MBT7747260.1 branched-chain amino acid ABC transporter permease [Alphaproteobacteria bacterium]